MQSPLRDLAEFVAQQERSAIDPRLSYVGDQVVFCRGDRPVDLAHEIALSKVVHPPRIEATTLQAIVDYYAGGFDKENTFVHVTGPCSVHVSRIEHQIDGYRDELLLASYKGPKHWFEDWLPVSSFTTWLLSAFVKTEDSERLLSVLGKGIKIEAARQVSDDGVSVQLKRSRGVTGAEWTIDLPPHLTLRPRRTFPEVEQPEALCVFRVKNNSDEEGTVLVRLLEADGGAWRQKAISNIGSWLLGALPADIAVLA